MRKISIENQIYLAISYRGTSVSAIARALGMTQQNLQQKITRNTLKKEDLHKIAKALNAEYMSFFVFPDGLVIGDSEKLISKPLPGK